MSMVATFPSLGQLPLFISHLAVAIGASVMEAAGFASAIITFVEFAYKLVNGSITAYESGTGLVDQDVTRVVNDLEAVTKAFDVAPIEAASGLHWVELRELAIACNSLSNELILILQKARRRQDGNRALRSFGAAWASLRSSKDVMEIQRKLNEYRAQILLRLSLILDGRQQWIAKQLEELHTGNARYFRETVVEFESLQSTIKELESRLSKQVLEDQRNYDPKQDHSDSLAEIHAELSRISSIINGGSLKNAATGVLERLRFETMYSRVDHIGDGEFQFFSWLFDDDHEVSQNIDGEISGDEESSSIGEYGNDEITDEARQAALASITKWLEVGDKVLHISGKAGSGKSTLMKRLSLDAALKKKLERWSGDKTLVRASFFFWGTGDKQQNSLEGLYRSILYELLMKYPELIIVAFPELTTVQSFHATSRAPFRLMELRQALANLIEVKNALADHRFCFFIDGLDEYDGNAADHIDLAQQLRRWAKFPNVKICASSRPHQEFHSMFDVGARICLHKLTASDIHRYAYEAFHNCPGLKVRMDYDIIARSVVWKAEGVFLWARLAIPALLGHLQYSVDASEILFQLQQLPSNLDSLFTRLFDSISASERTRAYRLLLLVKEREESNAIALSWVDDLKDADFPFNRPRRSCSDEEISRRVAQVEHQLKVMCKGLLELQQATQNASKYFEYNVGFMHRSVRDFLENPDTVLSMKRHVGAAFDAALDDQRLNLAAFKFARWDYGYYEDLNPTYWEILALWRLIPATLHACKGTPRVLDELESILDCYRAETANNIDSSLERLDNCHLLKKESSSWGHYITFRQYTVGPWGNDAGTSFPHYLAFFGHVEALLGRVKQHGSGYYKKSGLCLILSAFLCQEPARMMQGLLNAGVLPRDAIIVISRDGKHCQRVPFWVMVAAIMACQVGGTNLPPKVPVSELYSGLEVLLRAGVAPSPELRLEFLVVHRGPVFFSFEEFIIVSQPANADILIRELRRLSWRGRVGQRMGSTAGSWLPSTTMTLSPPLSEYRKDSEGFIADRDALRRVWVGADMFEVDSFAPFRVA